MFSFLPPSVLRLSHKVQLKCTCLCFKYEKKKVIEFKQIRMHLLQDSVDKVYVYVSLKARLLSVSVFQTLLSAARLTSQRFPRSDRKLSTPRRPAPWVRRRAASPGRVWCVIEVIY